MLKIISTLLLIIFISSCCGLHTEVKYKHKNVVVTRVDECGETSFYYGEELDKNKGRIWVEYSGINDGFKGYLEFHENGKVTILSGDGYFQSDHIDTSQFEFKRIAAFERPVIGDSVCYINIATNIEQEDNISEGSGVKIEYSIDDNEWW